MIRLNRRQFRERGATAVEYALVAVLIAVVIVAVVTVLGQQVSNFYTGVAPAL